MIYQDLTVESLATVHGGAAATLAGGALTGARATGTWQAAAIGAGINGGIYATTGWW